MRAFHRPSSEGARLSSRRQACCLVGFFSFRERWGTVDPQNWSGHMRPLPGAAPWCRDDREAQTRGVVWTAPGITLVISHSCGQPPPRVPQSVPRLESRLQGWGCLPSTSGPGEDRARRLGGQFCRASHLCPRERSLLEPLSQAAPDHRGRLPPHTVLPPAPPCSASRRVPPLLPRFACSPILVPKTPVPALSTSLRLLGEALLPLVFMGVPPSPSHCPLWFCP